MNELIKYQFINFVIYFYSLTKMLRIGENLLIKKKNWKEQLQTTASRTNMTDEGKRYLLSNFRIYTKKLAKQRKSNLKMLVSYAIHEFSKKTSSPRSDRLLNACVMHSSTYLQNMRFHGNVKVLALPDGPEEALGCGAAGPPPYSSLIQDFCLRQQLCITFLFIKCTKTNQNLSLYIEKIF